MLQPTSIELWRACVRMIVLVSSPRMREKMPKGDAAAPRRQDVAKSNVASAASPLIRPCFAGPPSPRATGRGRRAPMSAPYASRTCFDSTVESATQAVDHRHAGAEFDAGDRLRRRAAPAPSAGAQRIAVRATTTVRSPRSTQGRMSWQIVGQHARERVAQAFAAGRGRVVGAAPDHAPAPRPTCARASALLRPDRSP